MYAGAGTIYYYRWYFFVEGGLAIYKCTFLLRERVGMVCSHIVISAVHQRVRIDDHRYSSLPTKCYCTALCFYSTAQFSTAQLTRPPISLTGPHWAARRRILRARRRDTPQVDQNLHLRQHVHTHRERERHGEGREEDNSHQHLQVGTRRVAPHRSGLRSRRPSA